MRVDAYYMKNPPLYKNIGEPLGQPNLVSIISYHQSFAFTCSMSHVSVISCLVFLRLHPCARLDADIRPINYDNDFAKSCSLTQSFHPTTFSASATNFELFHKEDLVTRGLEGMVRI